MAKNDHQLLDAGRTDAVRGPGIEPPAHLVGIHRVGQG
jgi:hypothetical protein